MVTTRAMIAELKKKLCDGKEQAIELGDKKAFCQPSRLTGGRG